MKPTRARFCAIYHAANLWFEADKLSRSLGEQGASVEERSEMLANRRMALKHLKKKKRR